MGQLWLDGYSAAVEVYLLVDGQRHDVAQIGGGSLILRSPHSLPANTHATLVILIDGEEERHEIMTLHDAQYDEPVAFF